MYEEMTYEYLLNKMLEDGVNGVDTHEGSLMFHSCAKQAVRLEEAFQKYSVIDRNTYITTADLAGLIEQGNDRGVIIHYATFSEFRAKFNLQIEPGTRFNGGSYNYTVLDELDADEYIYSVVCDTAGKEPNTFLTELTPIDYIDGFEKGELLECIKPGTDMEDTESYRSRLLASMTNHGSGGSRTWYRSKLKEYQGVGGVKLSRVKAPGDFIIITVISSDFSRPSDSFIDELQTYVDPIVNSGEGYGIAPIGHKVTIVPVEELQIDFETTIVYEENYQYEDVQAQITAAFEKYFLSLRKDWEAKESLVVRINQMEAELIGIPGILDVSGTKLNGGGQNILLSGAIPVKGEIVCS